MNGFVRLRAGIDLRRIALGAIVAAAVTQAVPADAAGDPVRGANVFKRCSACHSATADTHSVGPSLRTVANRKIASVPGYKFSPALSSLKDSWTPENLDRFLLAPQQYAKGTRMAFTGLKKPEDRADVVAYLQSIQKKGK